MSRVLVTGAAGFIGGHLVKRLRAEGHWVRGIDIRAPEYENSVAHEFWVSDLRLPVNALHACSGMDAVYHLAAEMGGMGALRPHDYSLRLGNARIDQNTIDAAMRRDVKQFFYASTACVYNETLQGENASALKEEDAYPAQPDLAYGWVKLQSEMLLLDAAMENFNRLQPYIARFHNCYGALGSYDNGKEKAPAALCRKIALAKLRNEESISVWGDGLQRRSFMYIGDCIEGILRLTASDCHQPINLGRNEQISINELALLIMDIADWHVRLEHDLSKPQGVRSRNSNNARLREVLNWQPSISLAEGLSATYEWIESQVFANYGVKNNV